MTARMWRREIFRWGIVSIVWCASCVGQVGDPNATDTALAAPARVGFEKVADAMQPSCGTLDCHGQVGRNLRLYGGRGLRLAAVDSPIEGVTTRSEYDATYWAVVGIEPEILAAVVRDGGANPERLSLVRKGRGVGRHKGGKLMTPGDPLDRCIVEWIKGNIPVEACDAAAMITAPGREMP